MVGIEMERGVLTRRLGPAGAAMLLRVAGPGAEAWPRVAADPALGAARAVVATGVAGGCAPETRPGDLVLAETVGRGDGKWRATDDALRNAARHALLTAGLPHHVGRLLTVDRPLATPEAKAAAWHHHGALAAEMETAVLADWAAARALPLLAVRAIADGPADLLPPRLADLVDPRGRLRVGRLVALLGQPALVLDAWRLWRRSRLALARLAHLLGALAAVPTRP